MRTEKSDKRLGILFLGGAKRITMARYMAKAAEAYGFHTDFTSYELATDEPIAAISDVVVGLKWNDPAVVADIERVVRERKIGILIPFVDGAIGIAATVVTRNPAIYCPSCNDRLAMQLFDKTMSAKLFANAGLDIPATWCPGTDPVFPLIAKPRCGSASSGIRVVRSEADLNALPDTGEYLIQEFIEGADEYTVDCFVSMNGGSSMFSPRRRVATLGGEVIRTVTVDIPELLQAARCAADRLGLRGAFTIQYLHRGDRFLLMEINPRLGGGATASVAAGADIPAMIIEDACGLPVAPRKVLPGVTTVRCFQDVTFIDGHAHSNL